jgi:hypothetical protein
MEDNNFISEAEYYERALQAQSKKIASQALELSRMHKIYMREVSNTSFSEAFGFLIRVIINKIKK